MSAQMWSMLAQSWMRMVQLGPIRANILVASGMPVFYRTSIKTSRVAGPESAAAVVPEFGRRWALGARSSTKRTASGSYFLEAADVGGHEPSRLHQLRCRQSRSAGSSIFCRSPSVEGPLPADNNEHLPRAGLRPHLRRAPRANSRSHPEERPKGSAVEALAGIRGGLWPPAGQRTRSRSVVALLSRTPRRAERAAGATIWSRSSGRAWDLGPILRPI